MPQVSCTVKPINGLWLVFFNAFALCETLT